MNAAHNNEVNPVDINNFLPPSPETELRLMTAFDSLAPFMNSDDTDIGESIHLSTRYLHKSFPNGSRVHATLHSVDPSFQALRDIEGNDIDDMLISTLDISNPHEDPISYSKRADEEPKIFIRSLAEKAIRQIAPQGTLRTNLGSLTIEATGTQEFKDFMMSRSKERAEVDRLGVTKPTEGSVRLLAAAIEDIVSVLSNDK